jgi:ERCC4 domain
MHEFGATAVIGTSASRRPGIAADGALISRYNARRHAQSAAEIDPQPSHLDSARRGLEDVCLVERKDLADLVHSLTTERSVFISRVRRMSRYPHRLLVITAALSQVKSAYTFAAVDPNRILQSLIAVLAGTGVPFLCTETHELAEEVVASYLYQVHLYHWLETNDFGRYLADRDL